MGVTRLGTKAPYGLKAKALSFDIRNFNYENQVAPLMLSTKGRCVWSDKAVTGRLFGSVEKKFAELGPDTLFLSYYTEDRPVRAKGLLWALHQGVGKSIRVLLNDFEAPVEAEVCVDELAFQKQLKFAPRQARFIYFDGKAEVGFDI